MILSLFSLLSFLFVPSQPLKKVDYSSMLHVEDGVLVEVIDKTAEEVRIYENDHVTSIAENAFDGCAFTTIMISHTVNEISALFPNNVIINYTGALPTPFNTEGFIVNEYACDEGFLNFWGTYIRPHITDSICEVKRVNYDKMINLYNALSIEDKDTVNNTVDGSSTIKDSVEFLKTFFKPKQSTNTTKEITQSTMITIILVIASIGMTSIGIFYFLKDKNIIG